MANPSFKSASNKPLYMSLHTVMGARGFMPQPPSSPDWAGWGKSLSATTTATISVSLGLSQPPDTWSIGPMVIIDSRYVAQHSARLRLDRDCWSKPDDWVEPDMIQILRFLPGYLRWQDDPSLSLKVFRSRPETLPQLCDAIIAVFDQYVQPVLDQMGTPAGAAQFHENAIHGNLAKRGWVQPSYSATNPYIATALLWREAGCPERALAILEGAVEQKAAIQSEFTAVYCDALFCKINKLIADLRGTDP